ncbi:MAG: cellulose binding domain-containing protein, partial [Pseudomonadota bacterium]
MPVFTSNSASLDMDIRNTWETGLVVDFLLSPDQALNGWTVEFEYSGEIVNIWNGQVISRTGDRYVVQNVGYNAEIAAGASTGFGFQGSGASHTITPIAIAGEAVGGG